MSGNQTSENLLTDYEIEALLLSVEPELPRPDNIRIVAELVARGQPGPRSPQTATVLTARNRHSWPGRMVVCCAMAQLLVVFVLITGAQQQNVEYRSLTSFQTHRRNAEILEGRLASIDNRSQISSEDRARTKLLFSNVHASESLWMLAQHSQPQQREETLRSILTLYENTPAADRCRRLVINSK